jgi:hypothetical protein
VFIDAAGNPQFTINDEDKRQRHLRDDLCPLCGTKLFRGRWFVGGPLSAFHPRGAYIDAPMHHDCAVFALMVCPYLAAPKYAKRIDVKKLAPADGPRILVDPTVIEERPALFVAAMTIGQKVHWEGLQSYVHPKRPWRAVEYCRHGRCISKQEAESVCESVARCET